MLNPSKSDLNGTFAWEGTNQATAPADQPSRRDEELEGTETDDQLEGEQGNDTIEAGAGDDTVNGGAEPMKSKPVLAMIWSMEPWDDTIEAGDGDDTLDGGWAMTC